MSIITVIVSFLVSLLTGIGVGGGGLLVLYLSLALSMDQHTAQSLNLLFFLVSSLSSLPIHLQKRRIHLPAIAILVLFGLLGTLFGAYLTSILPSTLVKKLFGGFLILSGILVFMGKKQKNTPIE